MDKAVIWILDNVIIFSFGVVIVAIAIAIGLLIYSYRLLRISSIKSQIATFGAQALMIVLVSLWLNNLFALARDREQRKWTLRQDHVARLQLTIRKDSEKLSEMARRITVEGRVTDINKDKSANESELEALFTPDVLTGDLANHYTEYWAQNPLCQYQWDTLPLFN